MEWLSVSKNLCYLFFLNTSSPTQARRSAENPSKKICRAFRAQHVHKLRQPPKKYLDDIVIERMSRLIVFKSWDWGCSMAERIFLLHIFNKMHFLLNYRWKAAPQHLLEKSSDNRPIVILLGTKLISLDQILA